MNSDEFQRRLADRATAAGIAVSPQLSGSLEAYFRLLSAWNEKINLTALPLGDLSPAAVDRLLIEPLVAARHVSPGARTVMDVGSGGGSPAIPFALATGLHLTMVESRSRKAVFLREALRVVGLSGTVIATRLETLADADDRPPRQDIVTVRAVRADSSFLKAARSFLAQTGKLFFFTNQTGAVQAQKQLGPVSAVATLTSTSSLLILAADVPRGTS